MPWLASPSVLIACLHHTPLFALFLTCWSFHDGFTRCKNQLLSLCVHVLPTHQLCTLLFLLVSCCDVQLWVCVCVCILQYIHLIIYVNVFARWYLRYFFFFLLNSLNSEWIELTTLQVDSPLLTFSHTFAWTGKLYFCLLMDCMLEKYYIGSNSLFWQ